MRRPLSLSALATLVCAVGLARATPPKDPPPELLDTACSSGLLLQPVDAGSAPTDAAPADDDSAGDAAFEDAGLFGGSDSGDEKGDKGEKKAKKKKPKPKARLLRPRSDKDKADCPGKVSAFYRAHGDRFNAVPAPANLSAEQIEGSIDRVYAASFGPAKGALMSDLKGEDISKKWDVVNRIFDGIGPKRPLDDAAFGVTVSKNLHDLVNDKVILPSDLGGKTPEELTAKTSPAEPAAPAKPLPPGMTEHRNPKIEGAVPALGGNLPIKPPERFDPIPPFVAPADPGWLARHYQDARAVASDYASNFRHPENSISNYEGRGEGNMPPFVGPLPEGSDASINVRLPQATGLSPHCEPGCYGTRKMIDLLVAMGEDFSTYYKGERTMSVGGISKKGGGYFPPHVSHQKGIDADITFQSNHGFDVYANAMIVAAVIRKMPNFRHLNGEEYILCDQSKHAAIGWGLDRLVEQKVLTPEQAARGKSVLVHWPGHNDHFHIRVLMPPNPN